MNKQKNWIVASLGLLVVVQAALAHVTLESPKAVAGEAYKAVLRIGHGCAGAATDSFTAYIPDGVVNAKPMPKVGWSVRIQKTKLATPYVLHGRPFTETATEITWTANSAEAAIADDQYDEFVIRANLPSNPTVLWWSSMQRCKEVNNAWIQKPAQGISTKGLPYPAALLEVLPAVNHSAVHH